ncbi:MAG TPA: hypothetical protein VFY13_10635 [Luteolibacter sp.]|nr:hypothetical protein [Luteolibacter sp.]
MLAYFPHIPKTGGQTLLHGFYSAFGRDRCLKVWDDGRGSDMRSGEFPSLLPSQFKKVRAVVGHLPVSKFMENEHASQAYERGRVRIFTSVRDPIDRIISLYNYMKFFPRHPAYETMQQVQPTDFIMRQATNYQLNFIKPHVDAGVDEVFDCMEVAALEVSIEALGKFLRQHFGRRVEPLGIRNKSEMHANGQTLLRREHLPDDVIQDLNQRHALDLELYHRARAGQGKR